MKLLNLLCIIYILKQKKSDFHVAVSFDPVKMSQQDKNKFFFKCQI